MHKGKLISFLSCNSAVVFAVMLHQFRYYFSEINPLCFIMFYRFVLHCIGRVFSWVQYHQIWSDFNLNWNEIQYNVKSAASKCYSLKYIFISMICDAFVILKRTLEKFKHFVNFWNPVNIRTGELYEKWALQCKYLCW